MKVFVSWSGDKSKKVAGVLKEFIPQIIQSVEVFYSPEDIEKGQNWNAQITKQLSEASFGIVCLTKENREAPWINFEAGAIAKELDSKTSALLIDLEPSEIQGPLSSYQATSISREDFYKLIKSINESNSTKLPDDILETAYKAFIEQILEKIEKVIQVEIKQKTSNPRHAEKQNDNLAYEEILKLLRNQEMKLNDVLSINNINTMNLDNRKDLEREFDKIYHTLYVVYESTSAMADRSNDTWTEDYILDICAGISNMCMRMENLCMTQILNKKLTVRFRNLSNLYLELSDGSV